MQKSKRSLVSLFSLVVLLRPEILVFCRNFDASVTFLKHFGINIPIQLASTSRFTIPN